jgi:hypothetical protein
MKRLPDWRSRLAAATEAHRRDASGDCALKVADAIAAMTGVDLAAPYRGRYTTIAEGLALLAADGYDDLCAFAAAHLEEVHPSQARVGDVMAFEVDGLVDGAVQIAGPPILPAWSLGIVNGERVTVWRGDGLGTMPRDLAKRAFRVPS